jgi:HK97 family phage prohead protease
MREIERRSMGPVNVRAASEEKPAQLVGYAAVFNSKSEDLGGFREIILPGAFDRALSEGHDVRAFVNHNPDKMLGRTASKTARLSIDEHGLAVEIDVPDTQDGRDTMTLAKRGDLSQMSFSFRTLDDRWRTDEGEPLRELVDLELFDVSVVAFPAYPATEVSARALERAQEIKAPPPPPLERLARQIGAIEREEG